MGSKLPDGFDRADGLEGRVGTPNPAGSVNFQGVGGATSISQMGLEENPDSPRIERAEQDTFSRHFTGPWEEVLNRLFIYKRGNITTDPKTGFRFFILSSEAQHGVGGKGMLSIVSECKSWDTPPDEFRIVGVDLGLNIIKHPRYFYAFIGSGYGSDEELLNQQVIRRLQDYMDSPDVQIRNAITKQIYDSIGHPGTVASGVVTPPAPYVVSGVTLNPFAGTDLAKRAALEVIQKFWRNIETPYIVGWQINWSQYFWRPQPLHPGGIIEDPILDATPQLPPWFFSTDDGYPPDPTRTIFDNLVYYNPQCYSSTGTRGGALQVSWLRKADEWDWQRTWFKVERTWLGSPVGHWDAQLFSSGDRPSSPSDYLVTSPTFVPSTAEEGN